ncbi:serine-type D-Ala-D-Ala carboxypeptidase [Legionella lansingensis]|uniref:Serine-type D-Ala-D-Ala carboxypeptidase n=1 Tax=Legionella lansingensis TaxID=45067 RepID=A0A0W0VFY1_9GAMM|nr:D-alanyl-D-alanine carboxypeptidase [Legionella lansingensis]KTD19077.1 serine-type D-Ala-D-Ala carboxypeptidase [Legionella lansingensis]SNV52103.1 serine-type D-Ala-D-Ala carboxypeptidase [Legionella lansingensis]
MHICRHLIFAVLLLQVFSIEAKSILLINAIEKAPSILINNQKVQAKYDVINNTPFTLKNNALTNIPSGVRQITTGQRTCQHSFNLLPGTGCILILEINAAAMKGNIHEGPKICQTSNNAAYCSVPASQDVLLVKKNKDIDAILNKPLYQNSKWGLRVIDLKTGSVLINLRPHYQFFIGSVRKLFSVGALLNQVGSNYRFRTPLIYKGTLDANGVLNGDLILIASGDLTMGGRTLPNGTIAISNFDHNEANTLGNAILTSPDPLAGYKTLAKRVYDFGIKRVTGNVIIDDRLFVPFRYRNEFNVRPIFVNDDVIDVSMEPTRIGNLASVNWRPVSAAFTITSELLTTDPNTVTSYKLDPELPSCIGTTPCQGQVTGNLSINFIPPFTYQFPLVQTFRVVEPANYARTVFIEALKNAGVMIDASSIAQNPTPPIGPYTPITELVSPPFSEYAKFILKVSYNIGADVSLILFGLTQGVNNMAEALAVEKSILTTHHNIPSNQFTFMDGSGGGNTTATNLVVTEWLKIMTQLPSFSAFFDALPVLGVDGSLATVTEFQTNPTLIGAKGEVHAKTGTYIQGSPQGILLKGQSFGGYIDTKSGRRIIYQLVVNDVALHSITDVIEIFQDEGIISAILWRDL